MATRGHQRCSIPLSVQPFCGFCTYSPQDSYFLGFNSVGFLAPGRGILKAKRQPHWCYRRRHVSRCLPLCWALLSTWQPAVLKSESSMSCRRRCNLYGLSACRICGGAARQPHSKHPAEYADLRTQGVTALRTPAVMAKTAAAAAANLGSYDGRTMDGAKGAIPVLDGLLVQAVNQLFKTDAAQGAGWPRSGARQHLVRAVPGRPLWPWPLQATILACRGGAVGPPWRCLCLRFPW